MRFGISDLGFTSLCFVFVLQSVILLPCSAHLHRGIKKETTDITDADGLIGSVPSVISVVFPYFDYSRGPRSVICENLCNLWIAFLFKRSTDVNASMTVRQFGIEIWKPVSGSRSINSHVADGRWRRRQTKGIHRLRRFSQITSIPKSIQSVKICAICGSTHSSTDIMWSMSCAAVPTDVFVRFADLN